MFDSAFSQDVVSGYTRFRDSATETVIEPFGFDTAAIERYVRDAGLYSFVERDGYDDEPALIFENAAMELERNFLADPQPLSPRKGRGSNADYNRYFGASPAFAPEFMPEPRKFREQAIQSLTVFCDHVNELVAPSYAVGACVRDTLLGLPCHDYDFCTPNKPIYVENMLRRRGIRNLTTTSRSGSVGFKFEGRYVEMATFLANRNTRGNHVDEFEFVDRLETDLGRRDFTINAIAFIGGNIIDPFDGYCDLQAHIIRAIGRANMRVEDNPMLILRAARYASQFDFRMDDELVQATRNYWHLLAEVPRERWSSELDNLLAGKNPIYALNILKRTDALNLIFPELAHLNDASWEIASRAIANTKAALPGPCDNLVVCANGPHCLKGSSDANERMRHVANKRLAILLAFTSPHAAVVKEVGRRIGYTFGWDKRRIADFEALIDILMSKECALRDARETDEVLEACLGA